MQLGIMGVDEIVSGKVVWIGNRKAITATLRENPLEYLSTLNQAKALLRNGMWHRPSMVRPFRLD